ncbi:MAG: TetR/AcrR family transcriptional regulator [Porcipelethomonas sp.]
MGKLDMNKKQKRESLLNTAFAIFTDKGVSKTSISEIVEKAGVAKGTFYLYFKDKYDLKNKLISHQASLIFKSAVETMDDKENLDFEDKIIFIIDNIINQFQKNPKLLGFISKNLSWGIFKNALTSPESDDINFKYVYEKMIEDAPVTFDNPELMLFMIVELVSSTVYSSILYGEPVEPDKLKPYLYRTIRMIIKSHEIGPKE